MYMLQARRSVHSQSAWSVKATHAAHFKYYGIHTFLATLPCQVAHAEYQALYRFDAYTCLVN